MDNSNQQNDFKILMQLAKNGDIDAFSRLYEIYFAPVFRYIYLRTKNKEETEDLVQTVFLKVYKNIENFQEKNVSPLAYFFTVARHTVIDYWRKRKEINTADIEKMPLKLAESVGNPAEVIEKKETYNTIRTAIKQLTEEQQEVIILKFINEMKNEEIAKILGKTEEAIRQLQCRALKTLREILKNSEIL